MKSIPLNFNLISLIDERDFEKKLEFYQINKKKTY